MVILHEIAEVLCSQRPGQEESRTTRITRDTRQVSPSDILHKVVPPHQNMRHVGCPIVLSFSRISHTTSNRQVSPLITHQGHLSLHRCPHQKMPHNSSPRSQYNLSTPRRGCQESKRPRTLGHLGLSCWGSPILPTRSALIVAPYGAFLFYAQITTVLTS